MSKLATNLRKIRQQQNLSLRELSKKSKISHSYIELIEIEVRKNPSLDTLNKLAEALNVPISELLG